jgi:hypothetical protein
MDPDRETALREKLRKYVDEELESDTYNDDVDTVQPDYEVEELGNIDASTADSESQHEAIRRAHNRAHAYARSHAEARARDRLEYEERDKSR